MFTKDPIFGKLHSQFSDNISAAFCPVAATALQSGI